MGRACSTQGAKLNSCMVLVRKPEGKRPLGSSKYWWEDYVKMDLRERSRVALYGLD
jgi:hypothetical protein